jgi:hypothetical protein
VSSAQKTPLAKSLPRFARQMAAEVVSRLGKALPGHVVAVDGAIVTVSFDVSGLTLPQVTIPLFGPTYIRYPIQVGDLGVAFPADYYLGGVSGLGGGTADTNPRGNLSCLVWFPIGNSNWTASANPNAVDINAPQGAILRNTTSTSSVTVTSTQVTASSSTEVELEVGSYNITLTTSGITITVGSNSIALTSGGVAITGPLTINGAPYIEHIHNAVTAGDQLSGPVNP